MHFISFMLLSGFLTSFSVFSTALSIDITYLKLHQQHAPALSNIIKMASDSGYQGARLAIDDSNTTGKFLQQHFTLTSFEFTKQQNLLARLKEEFNSRKAIFILDAPLPVLNEINLWAQNKNILELHGHFCNLWPSASGCHCTSWSNKTFNQFFYAKWVEHFVAEGCRFVTQNSTPPKLPCFRFEPPLGQ